ncbi:hypothetical protein Pr1d_34550 [Bythopirellula goksoeyrii]|uniref:Uncharacterized protein n=1 Tax=Bythopirellula goksoeyrii TaxID=1400387 RepID=A0A5B9QGR6_9BACT|nr:hypothetical protein Pr1d_34550 [Bythopirellula goksoeyrii]
METRIDVSLNARRIDHAESIKLLRALAEAMFKKGRHRIQKENYSLGIRNPASGFSSRSSLGLFSF